MLSFKIDGRSVSGLSVRRVSMENGGGSVLSTASCASIVGRGRMFIGSEDSDSLVLGWSRRSDRVKKSRSRSNMDIDGDQDELELDEEDVDDDEDDLYADNKPEEKAQQQVLPSRRGPEEDYQFRLHDFMLNVGPMTDVALRHSPQGAIPSKTSKSHIDLLTTSGRGEASGLTIFQQDIKPNLVEQFRIDNAQGIWSVCTKQAHQGDLNNHSQNAYNNYIFTSVITENGEEKPAAYAIKPTGLEEIKDTEFDADAGNIIDVGTINSGSRIVQVSQNEVRTYDEGMSIFVFLYDRCMEKPAQKQKSTNPYQCMTLTRGLWACSDPGLSCRIWDLLAANIMLFYPNLLDSINTIPQFIIGPLYL